MKERDKAPLSPCLRHGCSACCWGTEMTLSDEDVERLERAGHRGFCFETADGSRKLRNQAGHCVFLEDGRCGVYADRPEGCRLYPLVLYTVENVVDTDDFCPHRHEFRFTPTDRERLRASVQREEAQARRRKRRG